MESPVRSAWRLPLAFFACAAAFLLAAACGDGDAPAATPPGDGSASGSSPTAAGNASFDRATEPSVATPASKYTILHDDVGSGYLTDIKNTFVLDAPAYAKTAAFNSASEGEALLKQWGYVNGYESALTPEGGDPSLLNGAVAIRIESHLFGSVDGAKKAYDYFVGRLSKSGAGAISAGPVVNQSSAFKGISDKIRNSTIDRAIHEIAFRRGNLVVLVLTIGADPLMKVDVVRSLALVVDQKALGTKQALEPTPTSNYTPPAYTTPATPARTPTASATSSAAR
ncbi:MAG: hypothetical protein IT304_04840 [Dehalococcoidia bacterium]|nr:hypothetical protein [Dehalococcoidia bacterium]